MALAVETDKLTKRFGRTLALDSLDLEVPQGEVFGFLGPNGSGKTTTIRLLLGLLVPSSGTARVFGLDATRDAVAAHRRIAYIPGEFSVWPWLTGGEAVDFLGRLHGGLDAAYRDRLYARFEFDPHQKGRSYSKGNRQKIALVAAFASRADLLVLDEPTAGLDPLMEAAFRDCLADAKADGQTVFLSSHILSEVEAVCDSVGILRRGRLVEQAPLDALRHLAARTFEITFSGQPPDLASVPGVEQVTGTDHTLHCQVRGEVQPLVAALAGSTITDLRSHEASLEDIFLAYYGEPSDVAAAGRAGPTGRPAAPTPEQDAARPDDGPS